MSFINRGQATSLRCAMLGDIIGSLFEGCTVRGSYPVSVVTGFPRNSPLAALAFQSGGVLLPAKVELPVEGSRVTDDSVLSLAVADYLCRCFPGDQYVRNQIPDEDSLTGRGPLVARLKRWYSDYPDAGFGPGFAAWARSAEESNDSWGNGAAMRVSAVIDVADSLDEALALATETALPTHNHPEAIEGAQAIALAGYLVRHQADNDALCAELRAHFPDTAKSAMQSLDSIRVEMGFSVKSKDTVPAAIAVFLQSTDLEDLYRKVLSLGGDVDTIATMAASVAAYRFPMPEWFQHRFDSYLDERMQQTLMRFEAYLSARQSHREL